MKSSFFRHTTALAAALLLGCSVLGSSPALAAGTDSDAWKQELPDFDPARAVLDPEADRLILVEAFGTECRVSVYARCVDEAPAAEPQEIGPAFPALLPETEGSDTVCTWSRVLTTTGSLGAAGIGKTREGDLKTPQGLFSISPFAFGNADAPEGCTLPYHKVSANDYWCGDSASPYYDQLVDISKTGSVFDLSASEHLIDYGRYYNYCLNIEYNKEHTPGKGSALFLHCNRADGAVETTHGCISVDQDQMIRILQLATEHTWLLCDTPDRLNSYYASAESEL